MDPQPMEKGLAMLAWKQARSSSACPQPMGNQSFGNRVYGAKGGSTAPKMHLGQRLWASASIGG